MNQPEMGIPEFYQDQSILITGGSGFMGKVLIEKLLRSCPGIDKIFLIVRTKRGKDAQERIRTLFDIPLFDRLREERPNALDKVIAIPGDMMELGLNLSSEDKKTLQEQVSVVFNMAATVRFDDPIRDAVLMNVRGPRDLIELSLTMDKLKVFLHVSTTYSNVDHKEIEEKIYPSPGDWDWKKMIRIVEKLDDYQLRMLTQRIIGNRPNTYSFTKALGEQVVNDYKDRLPLVMVRPSIVLSTFEDPVPGWGDSFNGPVAIMAGIGKGIIRTNYADPDNIGDYVPVDLSIKAIIMAGWARGLKQGSGHLDIINCSSGLDESLTMRDVMKHGLDIAREQPLSNVMWYPNVQVTKHRSEFYVYTILFCLIPALIVDAGLFMMGRKQFMCNIQRKIYANIMMLSYFCNHQWIFHNENWSALRESLLPKDSEDWCFNRHKNGNMPQFGKTSFIGCRKYLLKEDVSTLPKAKMHLKRMYWIDQAMKVFFAMIFVWLIFSFSLPQRTFAGFHHLTFNYLVW